MLALKIFNKSKDAGKNLTGLGEQLNSDISFHTLTLSNFIMTTLPVAIRYENNKG